MQTNFLKSPHHNNAMIYRDLDIFDDCSAYLPDQEEVSRQCVRWLDEAREQYSILVISARIKSVVNPWLREYTASVMHRTLQASCVDEWSDRPLSQMAIEQIEDDLRRITKQARSEQVWDELGDIHQQIQESRSVLPTRVDKLEKKIDQMREDMQEEIEKLREEIQSSRAESSCAAHVWPLYCAGASKEERQTFDSYLMRLCSNPKTPATELKRYIRLKADSKVIERLRPMSREYEILRQLGVTFSLHSYQNA